MSATVLRELVAKLGFQVDDAQFKRAAAGVEKIKTAAAHADAGVHGMRGRFAGAGTAALSMGNSARAASSGVSGLASSVGVLKAGLVGLGLGALTKHLVGLASDANETDNVLSEVFGAKGSEEVKSWAETMSKEMGRSRYALRANAAALGAMLEPMTGSSVKAQEMSTHLAALAVDLGSFFNASDDDALMALKSGISGEAEPLRRFGIVLQDATLQEYAHEKGIKKKYTAMSVAEKTELRYGFILAHSTKAQGDAARTAHGYANATKRLGDNIKDLGTSIGQKLLPIAQKLVTWSDRAVAGFGELADKTYLIESAMAVLAAAALAYGLTIAAPFLLPAAAVLALIVAVDDLKTLFAGGKSATGQWLDEFGGIGTADKLVRTLTESFKAASEAMTELREDLPDLEGGFDLLVGRLQDVGVAIDLQIQKWKDFSSAIPRWLWNKAVDADIAVGIESKNDNSRWEADYQERATSRGLGADTTHGADDQLNFIRKQREERVRAESDERQRAKQSRREEAALAEGRRNMSHAPVSSAPTAPSLWDDDPSAVRFGQANVGPAPAAVLAPLPAWGAPTQSSVQRSVAASVTAPIPQPAAAGPVKNITVHNGPITINQGTGLGAAEAARAARQAADAERRRTGEALKRGA